MSTAVMVAFYARVSSEQQAKRGAIEVVAKPDNRVGFY
jgi:hypothetical protein